MIKVAVPNYGVFDPVSFRLSLQYGDILVWTIPHDMDCDDVMVIERFERLKAEIDPSKGGD